MTPRQRFINALERKPVTPGRVPHFELVFYLTMEAFGKVHPLHRNYHQWMQMSESERQLHRKDIARIYIETAEKYEHSAIFVHVNPYSEEEYIRQFDLIRDMSGDKYCLLIEGDPTYAVPSGDEMVAFSCKIADDAKGLKDEAARRMNERLERAERLAKHGGLDGFMLCSDYCLNEGPFLSPSQFGEFVAPYLANVIAGYRSLGFYAIKHTDGNIMPVIDQLIAAKPHALHSIDPQGRVDIATVKRQYGDKVCLIGNVNCGLMDTGTDEEVIASAEYALKHGMPGGGYIFSTSNCVYTGMQLRRYELILDVWKKLGNYR